MKKELMNLFMFIAICFLAYILFRNLHFKEGMTNNTTSATITTNSSNGIAGNASTYGASIKTQTIKMQDMLLISKYRADYETVILNLDDYVNNLMLQTALSVDQTKPEATLKKLADLNQSKSALNNVMKFIDSSH